MKHEMYDLNIVRSLRSNSALIYNTTSTRPPESVQTKFASIFAQILNRQAHFEYTQKLDFGVFIEIYVKI